MSVGVRFLLVLLFCLSLLWIPAGRVTVRADDGTPTAMDVTSEPTAASTVTIVPTVPTPRIRAEKSPVPSPTTPYTPIPLPTSGSPTPVTSAPALGAPDSGATSLLPSPAELEQDARLRWGKRIPATVRRWAYLIVPAGHRYGVDPNLVAAVITLESGGDPEAWNQGSDARGLMQVLHGPFDPAQNIDIGTSMLAGFLRDFHDLRLALAAYNAGPGAVTSYGGIPPYRETRDYVIIVTYLYDLYSHHQLSSTRRAQFRTTLHDLRKMHRHKQRIPLLAALATVASSDSHNPCPVVASCSRDTQSQVFPTMDPFWPMAGSPDPLQHVGPDVPPA